jgi:hypothetical protein
MEKRHKMETKRADDVRILARLLARELTSEETEVISGGLLLLLCQ